MKKMFISIFMLFVYLFNYNIYLENKYEDSSSLITNTTVNEMGAYYNYLLGNSPNETYNDEYYAPYYFKNLIHSFPLNSHGTCNFTSIAMLLSFYDTFWNDAVILEKYEVISTTQSYNIPNFETVYSPGLKYENETNYNMTPLQYSSFVTQTREIYFQSYLINLAIEANISISNVNLGANYNQVYNLIDYYLNFVNDETKNKFEKTSNKIENISASEFTFNKVSEGIPVLLRIGNSRTNKGHTVIAYDIGENNELYVHTGWKKNNTALTHVPLTKLIQTLGYNVVYDAIAITIASQHTHSYNYIYGNNETFCSCKYMYPQNVVLGDNYYTDTLPSFDFIATTKERWYSSSDYTYNIEIKDINNQTIINQDLNNSHFTFTRPADFNHLVTLDSSYSVKVRYNYTGSDTYQVSNEKFNVFSLPDVSTIGLTPSQTNLPTEYSNLASLVNYEINDYSIGADYYNTIYDEDNELLRLSCMPGEDNYASITYTLDFATTRVDFELAIKDENQGLDIGEYEVVLCDYDVNNNLEEITKVVGTNAIDTSLPVGINNLKKYIVYLEEPRETIVFKVKFLEGSLSSNSLGEIYYGNTSFYPYNAELPLPVSGYELPYEPDKWNNSSLKNKTNCYAYAIDKKSSGMIYPGFSDSSLGYYEEMIKNHKYNLDRIEADSINKGFTFIPIGRYEICPIGTYKVAFVLDTVEVEYGRKDYDFHFYRQNPDGTWSHKPGNTAVINYDYQNNVILDPLLADRHTSQPIYYYDYFVGYYAVSAINDNANMEE